MKIYLDNCCFNRPYDDQSQIKISLETQAKLYIQELIKNKKIELVSSYMLLYENYQNPFEIRKNSINEFLKNNTTLYVGYNKMEEIRILGYKIIETGVKNKDAIHIASAILANCDYFITTDIRLLKYKSDKIILLNPVEFVQRLDGEFYE